MLVAATATHSAYGDGLVSLMPFVALFAAVCVLGGVIRFREHRTNPHLCAAIFVVVANASFVLFVAWQLVGLYVWWRSFGES